MNKQNKDQEDFECIMCGEEYQNTLRFREEIVFTNGNKETNEPCCPDCISLLFTECADEIKSFKCELMED